ncbi:MAG TPA: VanZ family protein, partial [Anaerolineales bacterium]|nr:VanZ family protein [Anaerolineales bacterium]
WLPALLMMGIIFWFSSQPSSNLPNFDWADSALKKGGHMFGYALLSWSYWYALDLNPNKFWIAWLFAILYAMTDEYHQSFVIGRYPSAWDVFVFDNLGALLSLSVADRREKQKGRLSNSPNMDSSPLYPSK